MPISFQPTFSIQTTDTTLCMFRTAYLWGNLVNCHKIHKSHSDLDLSCFLHYGESELSAFCTLCSYKMWKMCKVHAPRIAEICFFGFLHLLSHKKPKRCKRHITIITECEKTRRTAQHAELNLSLPKSVSVYHDLIYFIWVGKSAEV